MSENKSLVQWGFSFLIIISAALTGCSKDGDSTDKAPPKARFQIQSSLQNLKVVDELGAPIVGAQVLIGMALDTPYTGNMLTTDATGSFVAPAAWNTALPITISATGYLRATYLNQLPGGQSFSIHKIQPDPTIELSGDTTGFKVTDYDDQVDFGVVMPAMTRSDILYFDLASFISPEMDKISIIGNEVKIPSNVTLPKQDESYFLPITLNKPKYRTYFSTPGMKKVVALRGQFPLDPVIDGARNKKKFYEMINYFSINGGSLKDVNVSASRTTMNLPVNEVNFNQKVRTLAPSFRPDEAMIVAAFQDQQGVMFPSDVKMMESGKIMPLATLPKQSPQLLFVKQLKSELEPGKNRLRMSVAITTANEKMAPEIIELMNDPVLIDPSHIQVQSPQLPSQLQPLATYALLMNVQKKTIKDEDGEDVETESTSRAWEVYGTQWATDIQLPAWPNETPTTGNKRWMVTLLASPATEKPVDLGPGLMNAVSHATSNTVDF